MPKMSNNPCFKNTHNNLKDIVSWYCLYKLKRQQTIPVHLEVAVYNTAQQIKRQKLFQKFATF